MTVDPQALVALVRDRLLLEDGLLEGDVRPFYEDVVPDLWVVPVFSEHGGRVAVVHAPGGVPSAQAGLARASARLRVLGVREAGLPWLAENLRPVLDAVGGLTPGLYPHAEEARAVDGDVVRVQFEAPVPWVRFAAEGGRGIPPSSTYDDDPRGIAPPEPMGAMVVSVDADCAIRWEYRDGDVLVGERAGHWEQDVVDADEPEPLLAERLVAAARRAGPSPLATAEAPVRLIEAQPNQRTWSVRLVDQPAVEIRESGGVPRPVGD